MDDDFTPLDGPEALANVRAAYDEALARLHATGRTEADAQALLALHLGRRARPAWYDLAWEVVSAHRQLRGMEEAHDA